MFPTSVNSLSNVPPHAVRPVKDEVNVFEESWKQHNFNTYQQLYPQQVGLDATAYAMPNMNDISNLQPDTYIPGVAMPEAAQPSQAAPQYDSTPSSYTEGVSRRGSDESSEQTSPARKHRKPSYNVDNADIPPLMKPVGRRGDITLQYDESGRALSKEERRKITMERNKNAAARCRQRKRQWTRNLQEEVDSLNAEQQSLKDEKLELQNEVNELRQTVNELTQYALARGI
ncbi:hypothetical protein E3P99_03269 [Wallemia hederae]|uniref:BZIP domain-containing protein n=1 Tax=Wallemia hederae TaxID=1540922 RepID=A0A4T0FG13_9BASI|nr:hypothetical protein E3P99_03269 [Wallemia hederae]